jgi:drug/metabolite transporter (DMT)-like permease
MDRRKIWQIVGGYGLLVVLSTIWGIGFAAIRSAVSELSPENLTLLRWFIASAVFLVLSAFIGKPRTRFELKDLPRILLIAFFNVPSYHLSLNFAETIVSAGVAGLLTSFGPIFIAFLSVYFLKEKMSGKLVLALALGVFGSIVLSIPNLGPGSNGSVLGPIGILMAALSYAFFSVLSKPLVRKYGPIPVTIWACLAGTLMLLPLLSPDFVVQVSRLSFAGWSSIIYLSLLSSVVGYLLFYSLVNRGAVSRLSVQLYLSPIISVIAGVVLLHEGLNIYTVIGGTILLLSITLATMNKK